MSEPAIKDIAEIDARIRETANEAFNEIDEIIRNNTGRIRQTDIENLQTLTNEKRRAFNFDNPSREVIEQTLMELTELTKNIISNGQPLKAPLQRRVTSNKSDELTISLPFCETMIALIAPKGRVDEFLGDHREELQGLVRNLGRTRGVWVCRLRLAGTILRMLPTIALRITILWRVIRTIAGPYRFLGFLRGCRVSR